MKVIIAGSRSVLLFEEVVKAVEQSGMKELITEIISGGARGADTLGELWAKQNNIPVKRFTPDWRTYGKPAGIIRNRQMGNYADGLIAMWDGTSRGTSHMIQYANDKGLEVFVYTPINK